MLRVGLNPYGLAYTLGLQGRGTPRANPKGGGLEGFLAIGEEIGAKTIEIFAPWLAEMDEGQLGVLRQRLDRMGMTPVLSGGYVSGPLDGVIRTAKALGAKVVRTALTPVLCGDRNAQGENWGKLVAGVRENLRRLAPQAAAAGVSLAIENHQDFRSEELVAFCAEAGPSVGICFDTGNTFPVGEAPLDFAARVAPHVRHVHLKDYNAQWTDEGYRLVRCAIGDGAVPILAIVAILLDRHPELTAVLEPGALEARHVRLFTKDWWTGYPPLAASELAACLAAARHRRLPDAVDYRTPWERQEGGEALVKYEMDMIRRSAANMRTIGLMEERA